MRLSLVFPASAGAGYVPLGVASLVAHARHQARIEAARCYDFNIQVWEHAARSVPGGQDTVDFFRGRRENFCDENSYRAHMTGLGALFGEVEQIAKLAKNYVETENLAPELALVLDNQIFELLEFSPSIIGISVLYPSQLAFALALAKRLKGRSPVPTVLGGATMSHINLKELLESCPYIDAAAVGEGEPILELMAAGRPFESIPNLACGAAHGFSLSPSKEQLRLENAFSPDFCDFDLCRYFSPEPVLPVLFSRGCRWRRCRFCGHNFSYGVYRAKEAAVFADELEKYRRELGVRLFYFADQYIEAESLSSIADEIIKRGLDIGFQAMVRPTQSFTLELLSKLRRAGCVWLSWGMESGSSRLLEVCDKGTSVERAREAIEAAKRADISNLLMMIFGLPTSGDRALEETFEFLESVSDSVDAFTASAFQLWEDTPFARRAGKYGLVVEGPETLLTVGGRDVHWRRLRFKEQGADGSLRPKRGPLEIARWLERRRWMGDESIYESLNAEHYLHWAFQCRQKN